MRLCVVLLAACTAAGLDAPAPPLALDRDAFRCTVEPVLEARCAFPACHGSARRPLALYAVGRMRYGVGWDRPKAPLTDGELADNLRIASGFATGDPPLLLAKPLEGAAFHRGKDLYGGGNVFAAPTDPGYQLLASWIAGATAAPDCQPSTEIGP